MNDGDLALAGDAPTIYIHVDPAIQGKINLAFDTS